MTTKFAVQVAKHVIKENLAKGKSVVCSPASIDAVLSMAGIGSVNKTQQQFLKPLLGHRNIVVKAPQTSYVNTLWVDQQHPLKAEFDKVLREVHNAHARVVDFVNQRDQAVNEANAMAKEETKGLIKQILTRKTTRDNNIKDDTALLLSNVLYFKGYWQNPLKSINSNDYEHQLPIHLKKRYLYDYGIYNDCQVISIPYKLVVLLNDDDYDIRYLSMYIFLPFEKDGLPNVIEKIEIGQNMYENEIKLKFEKIDVLSIPKFEFEPDIDLRNTMKQMGIKLSFENTWMDFSGIAEAVLPFYDSDLQVCKKCCVEIDEVGTEVVPVTGLGCGSDTCMRSSPGKIRFVADHPFMFMIRDDVSGAVLFVGTVLDPK